MSVDYKDTLFLPKTDFPMRAGLAKKEPEILARWKQTELFKKLRADARGREKFVLHDGPPYANGHLHIGHALNKILKDVINRSQQMMGKDAYYIPGWDCHGLPIEWKIEEKYRDAGKDKDAVPVPEFRQECRDFAGSWIGIQAEEFQRLGVEGHFDAPYTTMSFEAEAKIVGELGKFVMNGGLYKGAKPVMWSCVEKTALAEAEVEYYDHTSTTIYVRFPVATPSVPEVDGASVIIWTTTPWTIPGNRAVAYGEGIDYVVLEVTGAGEKSGAQPGHKIIVAEALVGEVCATAGIESHEIVHRLTGSDLAGTICRHPLHEGGYDFDIRLLPAGFVEVDTGTGFVHIAPGHGQDDWELGIANGVAVPDTVGPDGAFFDHVPLFAGIKVLEVKGPRKFDFPGNWAVMRELAKAENLLAKGKLVHSYPHSWRSKAPLIFRNTPQWFISMDTNDLRDKALKAIDETRFVPAGGQTRLRSMIESRPDWCVSRQRAWGVPIAVFVDKKTGEPLRDQGVNDRIVDAFREGGADVWFNRDGQDFLGNSYKIEDYDQVTDILDVWFDSGCTHSFVLEPNEDLKWPASLYLEGSDQHRGWFHSSLLESCGTRGVAPYEAVLTHGFVMAEDGQKMSKSLGNIVSPQDVYNNQGADILRLWVLGSDYSEDLRIGPEILKQHADVYRRLRNTFRFLLGNLNGWSEGERLPMEQMPELERWVLHRLWEMDQEVRQGCNDFLFHPLFEKLHNFCAGELSAFYLDIRKDSLYCDGANSIRRRAARTVCDILFDTLTAWLAPYICFTAEEAWLARNPSEDGSVHLRQFPEIPESWRDDALAEKWATVREVRRVVTGALEVKRADKTIGASLQAHPTVTVTTDQMMALDGLDLAEIAITSEITVEAGEVPEGAFTDETVAGIGVMVNLAEGEKCQRCWQVLPDVGDHGHEGICGRCAEAISD
ncbi:isoleucine--tRNA ligase [Magnetospira sp. QH-2]|uniref:isoleucine--tRNA ligase n=1 Tax=Magnetospira sp. (strain QH-2) TaxID=1288970 RepID=UPI0003E814F3|nr:isoleucine--tRNA ligase [Magnetospira sp. QH-2]CCQ72296.1 Isoleucine--tRNA ligase [Magnetospira sp. QH-2]